ncbi:MAG: cytochrome c [Bryobacterales bacterium]|nr:cytochrome c [Bryobacterales bacterium]
MTSLKVIRSLGVSLIAGAGLLEMAATAQAPASFTPVGNVSQLMIDIIYPTSDAIFYVDRDPPKNQKEWNDLRGQALMLAESGNLLMMDGRARDQGNWIKDSKMMIDAGAAAFKAAQAKDLDGIKALNDSLTAACVTCHQQYRPNYHRRPAPEAK